MTALRTILFLMLVMVILLVVAGCESQEPSDAALTSTTPPHPLTKISTRQPTITTINPPAVTPGNEPEPVPVASTIRESESSSPATVIQPGTYHPEYIRMDAIVYTVGEVVQFYLVNKGPDIHGCDYSHPAYTIFHLSPDGTRLKVSSYDPNRSYNMVISGDEPGSATGPFSLDTRRLVPGRYLIRFDCGNNVSRDFVIQDRSVVIEP
jgi:hypothetical protein